MEFDKLNYLKTIRWFDKKIITFVTILSVLYFVFIFLEFYLERFASAFHIMVLIDTIVCVIFLAEAFYFLFRAKNKKDYFKKYYLDFLSSIPLLFLIWIWPQLLFLSIFKILRGIKSIAKIYDFMAEHSKRKREMKILEKI
jgi:voltage-gated potassium channel